MSYNTIASMARDGDLQQRLIACAASEGVADPQGWTLANVWHLAATPGFSDAYQYAVDGTTVNQNPRVGQRDDVINDQMILGAVQTLRAAQSPA